MGDPDLATTTSTLGRGLVIASTEHQAAARRGTRLSFAVKVLVGFLRGQLTNLGTQVKEFTIRSILVRPLWCGAGELVRSVELSVMPMRLNLRSHECFPFHPPHTYEYIFCSCITSIPNSKKYAQRSFVQPNEEIAKGQDQEEDRDEEHVPMTESEELHGPQRFSDGGEEERPSPLVPGGHQSDD